MVRPQKVLTFIIGNGDVTTTTGLSQGSTVFFFFFFGLSQDIDVVEAWCAPGREISCQRFTSKYHLYDRSSNLVRLVEP